MNKLDLEDTTRRFHNVYEQVAKEYGYKTREDTKELDFNSPNGMTMLKTVETITTPYLEEIERLNNIIENLTTMTVNGDRTQIKNTAQYKIDRAIEYHDNCVNNLLDLDKIEENERLAYRVAYEIHDNYLRILKGVDKE